MHLPVTRYLGLLATYLKPQRRRVLLMAALLLAGIGYQFLNPQILKYFIDAALAGGASGALLAAGVLFIGLALVNQGISIAASTLVANVSWTATNQLRRDLVAHCLALDPGFFKERTSGELIERIDGDVDALSNFFSQFTVNLLSNALLLLVVLVLFFMIDWRVGVIMSAFAGVAFLVLLRLRRQAIPSWKESRQKSATFYGFLSEHLAGTADLRANGATDNVLRRFYQLL
ncbi:MAG TPA: ABC transporter ATP-binding protein, partial [Ktedonobacterales bacterium]|nr:ABC transporter ATP-binding protein [Ktedonobacterales bacterium]